MTTIPLSEAKNRLSELIDSVSRTHERVVITKNGRETAIIVSSEDYASLEATLELLADPDAQARVAQAEAEVAAGDVVGAGELAALLERSRPGR